MSARLPALLAALALACALPAWADPLQDAVARGRAIFLQGKLGDGSPLQGRRDAGNPPAEGETAACVNCHRHSGLGMTEGLNRIPPITGRFLAPPHSLRADQPDLPFIETMHHERSAYRDDTTARAIREGLDADGKTLSLLMPRYPLGDADMAALIAYLKSLDRKVEPGVTDTLLHFATVITPDADPARRQAMLAVLNQFLKDKNDKAFLIGPTAAIRPSSHGMPAKMMQLAPRRWALHVWELSGAPDTWQAQLEQDFAREPVLAVISGLGGSDWRPVHRFCEQSAVPCIFPNVDLPVDQPDDFYSLYFSGGLRLEADLIAAHLAEPDGQPRPVVRQVFRAGSAGAVAADRLSQALGALGIKVAGVPVASDAGPAGLQAAVRQAGDSDVMVMWLPASDVAALGAVPSRPRRIYFSGRMAGYEQMPLPSGWRDRSLLAFGVDLPERREVRMRYVLDWMRARQIPVTDLPLQADTWLACSLLSENINELIDAFIPEYLVEHVQDGLQHRLVTGYYPRLSLADHQRFASKGGYLMRFADAKGQQVVPVGAWRVPEHPRDASRSETASK